MRQVWIPRIGPPSVLKVREAPDPEPRPGEIRIRVAASGINFADILARMGLYPDAPKIPAVVGYEVAGTVDKLGVGASGMALDDRVLALTHFSGYSDVVVVPAAQVEKLPVRLSFEKAAAIRVNYLTAWIMLVTLGNAQRGDTVLVHAAAGGVGLAALQICRWRGAEVIGTASASKHARLRELGTSHCIDYNTQDFQAEVKRLTGGRGVDIVLDAVGGKSFQKSYASLAPLGRLFLFGVSGLATGQKRSIVSALRWFFALPSFKPIPLMNQNRGVFGVNLGHLWDERERLRAMLSDILSGVEAGHLDPVVDKTFPFTEAAAAHKYIQERKNFGKVLLVP